MLGHKRVCALFHVKAFRTNDVQPNKHLNTFKYTAVFSDIWISPTNTHNSTPRCSRNQVQICIQIQEMRHMRMQPCQQLGGLQGPLQSCPIHHTSRRVKQHCPTTISGRLGTMHAQTKQPHTSRLASSLQAGPGPSSAALQEGSTSLVEQQFSGPELDLLWSSVPRAFLKLGKSGAQESHARSLMELLPAHKIVKVQLNGNPRGAQEIGRRLATMANANLLAVQGPHMLFALASCHPDQLLELAQSSKQKQAAYHQKRLQARLEAESAQPGDVIQGRQQHSRGLTGNGSQGKAASSSSGSNNSERETGINKLISKVSSNKGGMSRRALQKEWDDLENAIYQSEIAETESEAQQPRSGSTKGPATPILSKSSKQGRGAADGKRGYRSH
ncbi:hypothetical protein DUNSADRAFT_6965 [Dunaliella salina]|uniref:Uncharacterized protein n=1 Tax=Dunaliella salina TaxID=3046 RepID=A0ABQ7GMA2_DUNSA|nr:hypothetical protein DUNSADRAFT_6965 [Dunaliella salina]|eukprot:KAF5835739.1 hypothetical protein DUNSADRAFT_6965 [Dunaliella salina]